MKPQKEQQVTSLEISKRLKDLGVKQESLFYWSFYDGGNNKDEPGLIFTDESNQGFKEDLISAFTVAELGEMLQEWKNLRLDSTKDSNGWSIAKNETDRIYADTEADARGKMLIYLLEHNLIKND